MDRKFKSLLIAVLIALTLFYSGNILFSDSKKSVPRASSTPDVVREVLETYSPTTQPSSPSLHSEIGEGESSRLEDNTMNQNFTVAVCLTGQLARLEVLSKVRNLIIPSLIAGTVVHLYVYLDSDVKDVGQTLWRFNYTNNPYKNYTAGRLKWYIQNAVANRTKPYYKIGRLHTSLNASLNVRVRLEDIPRIRFHIANDKVMVEKKSLTLNDDISISVFRQPKQLYEDPRLRFQNSLRMLASARECARWVMREELANQMFYDAVVRIRDDGYVFEPWPISKEAFGGLSGIRASNALLTTELSTFVVDREHLEVVMRSPVEDYYFNESLFNSVWNSTDGRMKQIAAHYGVPLLQSSGVCQQPVVSLRGLHNSSFWRLHPAYGKALSAHCARRPSSLNLSNGTIGGSGADTCCTAAVTAASASLLIPF